MVRRPALLAVFLALATALGLTACRGGGGRAGAGGKLVVAVSVPPQAFLVDRIGGEHVATTVLVPAGTEPHAYEPSPRQVAALEDARVYVKIGHPSFPFEKRFLDRLAAANPGLEVVDMSAGIELLPAAGDGHGIDPSATDPHVWLAPATMAAAAGNVAAALERVDPEHAADYRARLAGFLADVDRIDRRLRDALEGAAGRTFFVHHDAWAYLAGQYGLRQVAVETGGREPGPRRLVELVERARAEGVKVVFVQEGFSPRSAEVLAHEIGGRVVALDPLTYDWLASMERAAEAFEEAFDDDPGS